jgi:cell division septation protein DedD
MQDTPKHKRFYFYRDQLVVIAVAFAMTAAIILVLGMITGKTIVRRTVERTASAKIPVKPPPASADSVPEAQPDKNSVAEKDSKKAAARPSDREPAKEAKTQEKSAKADTINPMPQIKEPAKTAPQTAEGKLAERAASAPAAREDRQVSSAMWTIQVKSSTDKIFADQWVDRLKTKGHKAYIVEADVKGQTWYRVRVGQLNTRAEAEALQSALESQEGLSGTFLLKATK